MASPIQLLTPEPSSVLNWRYDHSGNTFGPRALRNMSMPTNGKVRQLARGLTSLKVGAVSYSPIMATDGTFTDGYPEFDALWEVCTSGDGRLCYFLDWKNRYGCQLVGVPIGVGDNVNRIFQIRRPLSTSGEVRYRNINFPIHGWPSALQSQVYGGLQNTLVVYVDTGGGPVIETHWTVVNTTGLITFDAGHQPPLGAIVSVDVWYVIPVFFLDAQPEIESKGGFTYIKDLRLMQVPQ
jgi:hypothetical protein